VLRVEKDDEKELPLLAREREAQIIPNGTGRGEGGARSCPGREDLERPLDDLVFAHAASSSSSAGTAGGVPSFASR